VFARRTRGGDGGWWQKGRKEERKYGRTVENDGENEDSLSLD